jgi:peroxiredoxin
MTAARTMHRFLIVALVMIAAAGTVTAAETPLGQIGPFKLADVGGRGATLDDWKDQKAALVFFLGAECPVSNGYAPSMQRLADKYAPRGVVSWGVHCDSTLTAEAAAQHAKEYDLRFRILLDPAQALAGPAGVRVTPEAVVVSPAGKVLYRGRIDDRYSSDGKRRDVPRVYDLEAALDAVLNGEVPKVSQTVSFGCPLPKPKAGSPVN